jgi:hypothetical protein
MWHLCAPPPSDSTFDFLVEVITAWILLHTDCRRRCRVLLLLESPLASAFFLSDRRRRVRLLQALLLPGQDYAGAVARSGLDHDSDRDFWHWLDLFSIGSAHSINFGSAHGFIFGSVHGFILSSALLPWLHFLSSGSLFNLDLF